MEEALEKIGRDLPSVALVDIGLPGISGIDGIRQLKQRYSGLLLVVLTVYDEDERIFEAVLVPVAIF
jgi:DNA-binding NarL/FixJ family response regulator